MVCLTHIGDSSMALLYMSRTCNDTALLVVRLDSAIGRSRIIALQDMCCASIGCCLNNRRGWLYTRLTRSLIQSRNRICSSAAMAKFMEPHTNPESATRRAVFCFVLGTLITPTRWCSWKAATSWACLTESLFQKNRCACSKCYYEKASVFDILQWQCPDLVGQATAHIHQFVAFCKDVLRLPRTSICLLSRASCEAYSLNTCYHELEWNQLYGALSSHKRSRTCCRSWHKQLTSSLTVVETSVRTPVLHAFSQMW